jgi:energy-coupling factor transporter ATP-binding protein EcfA2
MLPSPSKFPEVPKPTEAQGPVASLALHSLGWKAFQDLCAQVCEEALKKTVSVYREAQDGGQDAVFLVKSKRAEDPLGTGTVQCKFTSDPMRHFRLSDLNSEKGSITELVTIGQAYSYFYMTNMSVDAPIAAQAREMLQGLGVVEPNILGREWITLQIRSSSRLRALVPRVYGLGDLSIILDERLADQTKALLRHLLPSLGVYVPTTAHRAAVRTLGDNGIVMLLGPPASGKSMLASILATAALNTDGHKCYQIDGPAELMMHWNPHEPGGFYWIDDAFGSNQLRMDYVDHWIAIMNKVQAAMTAGNRFVLTSRSHIWKAAKAKLGTRNHPLFENGKGIVDLGALSPEEGAQMLYNHIKAGNQEKGWKQRIKPYIEKIAKESTFLPEIARRLGNQAYTSGVKSLPNDLIDFIRNPTEFLKITINELDDSQKAALTLVFLHRSRLAAGIPADESWLLVGDKFGISHVQLGQALDDLNGTFVVKKYSGATSFWSFFHPTIADALASFLRQRPDLVELYLRGAKIQQILSEVVCEECTPIKDALVVPKSMDDLLASRIQETPDEVGLNQALFTFLHERASRAVLSSVLQQSPAIPGRTSSIPWKAYIDPKICMHARAHALGLLEERWRTEIVNELEKSIFERFDSSVLDDDLILGLFPPNQLLRLAARLSGELFDSLSRKVSRIIDDADLDIDPESNFDEVKEFAMSVRHLFSENAYVQEKLDELDGEIEEGIEQVADQKDESKVEWEGEDIPPSRVTAPSRSRSLFSDVDL